jgi:predicted AAA+ superfamily ATPase
MFLIDEVKSWSPNFRSRIRVRGKSKIIFSDPSLACAVIDATPDNFLKDLNYFGFLFENLVIRDLKTFGSIKRFKVLQYRDSTGLECDAILEKDDGS